MKHKSYSNGLIVISDERGDRLLKIESADERKQLGAVDFLPTPQKFIKIYPEHNLIITPDNLYTLQGNSVISGNFELSDITVFSRNLLICSKINGEKKRVLIWNGADITRDTTVVKLLRNDKYIAALHDNWNIFDIEGKHILTIGSSAPDIRLGNDCVVIDEVGNHTVYSLKTGRCIMHNQQIVKISSWCDFAIGVDLQRKATIYCEGNISHFFEVSYIELADEAQLFYVRYGKSDSYVVYDYHTLKILAEDVNLISYDEEDDTLLIASPPEFCKYKVSTYDTMFGTKKCCIIAYENCVSAL
ncbi:MAG: hypothetical protein IJ532_06285 [Alphaproteobacteria bacterium]|nr:hypothetical protein [Alphaproteobacteria bacterium]